MAGRAVLFDLDNTLYDRDAALEAFARAQYQEKDFEAYGFEEDAWAERFVQLDARGKVWKDSVFATLRVEFALRQTVDELLTHYVKSFADYVQPRDDAKQVLMMLVDKGWRLGVVSNGRDAFQRRTLGALECEHWFDSVVISESCGCRKPDRRIFGLALDGLGAEAASSWFVGDDPIADVEGAKAAGLSALWFRTKGTHPPDFCDGTIDRLEQIESYAI